MSDVTPRREEIAQSTCFASVFIDVSRQLVWPIEPQKPQSGNTESGFDEKGVLRKVGSCNGHAEAPQPIAVKAPEQLAAWLSDAGGSIAFSSYQSGLVGA